MTASRLPKSLLRSAALRARRDSLLRASALRARRTGLLAGAAVIVLATALGGAAQAQVFGPAATGPRAGSKQQNRMTEQAQKAQRAAQKSAPTPDDGLGEDGFYLEADLLTRDDKNSAVVATGGVEARYHGRTIRAEEITYDRNTGVGTAKGKVTIIEADGGVETADEAQLDKDMQIGFARAFAAHTASGASVAADTAVRRSQDILELNRAIYTPCELCADNPDKAPTWSVKAAEVIQDDAKHMIYYRHAVISLFGKPVMYLPAFATPTPDAPASSGLLRPEISLNKRRGFSWEQPYLQQISPYSDIIIAPQINTKVNPFLDLNFRKRFYTGELDIRAGYTYEKDFDGTGDRFGQATSRSYILAHGLFQVTPDWRWGFSAERTSDDLLFDKYGTRTVYTQRGLFNSEDHRLLSQLYAQRQDQQSYFSISAISVQGLRPGDNDRTFPTIAPLIEFRYQPDGDVLGGRLRLRGTSVMLTRDQSPTDPTQPGADSKRASFDADWRSNITFATGLRASPFVQLRQDAYALSDLGSTAIRNSMNVTRTDAVAGIDFTMPFIKRIKGGSVILEPIAQLAVSPRSDPIRIGTDSSGQPIYFNEDSIAFEFDETNLFRADKFPGFDLYEGGQRLNTGVRTSVRMDNGANGTLLVGRSFRAERDNQFPTRTGLAPPGSDWVVAAQASYSGAAAFLRTRLDNDTLAVRRLEAGLDLSNKYGRASVRYLRDNLDISGVKQENLDLNGQLNITAHWGVTVLGSKDLIADVWRRRDIGVVYNDDCIRIDVIYSHEDQFTNTEIGRTIRPNETIMVRLSLATFGATGYGQ